MQLSDQNKCTRRPFRDTQYICVCTIHQNLKLLLYAIPIKETYQDLIKVITCNTINNVCVLCLCDKCPSSSLLQTHLESEIEDFDPNEIIQYRQRVSTDRMSLVVQVSSLSELCDLLIQKIEKLISHSFIAQSQSDYLKMRKKTTVLLFRIKLRGIIGTMVATPFTQ